MPAASGRRVCRCDAVNCDPEGRAVGARDREGAMVVTLSCVFCAGDDVNSVCYKTGQTWVQ